MHISTCTNSLQLYLLQIQGLSSLAITTSIRGVLFSDTVYWKRLIQSYPLAKEKLAWNASLYAFCLGEIVVF